MSPIIERCRLELENVSDILIEREQEHGSPDVNMQKVASFWSIYTGTKISAVDASIMLGLLKVARISTGNKKTDSIRDSLGYAAIAAGLSAARSSDD